MSTRVDPDESSKLNSYSILTSVASSFTSKSKGSNKMITLYAIDMTEEQ